MSHTVYILYSKSIVRYYIGVTGINVFDRLRRHNSNHKGFTGRSKDWEIVFTKELASKEDALLLEKSIKKRGAKRYMEDIASR